MSDLISRAKDDIAKYRTWSHTFDNLCQDLISREDALNVVCEFCEWEPPCGDDRCDEYNAMMRVPSADAVSREEDILKFYYVESIDDYWIGRRMDNYYYADWHDGFGFVWSKSRYLPWGEHVVAPETLWKENTYPSEPKEIPFTEWIIGFMQKYGKTADRPTDGDIISRADAIEYLKHICYESAMNNDDVIGKASEVFVDIAENRIGIWINDVPSADRPRDGDLISRADAIEHLIEHMCWFTDDGYETSEEEKVECITNLLNGVPSADRYESAYWDGFHDAERILYQANLDNWCTDCKEYDSDKHCCPRFNRVIRSALKDADRPRGEWIIEPYPMAIYTCPVCDNTMVSEGMPNYCCRCGARLEGNGMNYCRRYRTGCTFADEYGFCLRTGSSRCEREGEGDDKENESAEARTNTGEVHGHRIGNL